MRRSPARSIAAGGCIAALVTVAVAGCADHASAGVTIPSDAPASTSSVPTDSASPSPGATITTADSSEQARIRASHDAGKPMKNLVWRVTTPPKTWAKLPKVQDGLQEWHVTADCRVRLWQLNVDSGDTESTNRDVLDFIAARNSNLFPGRPKPVYRSRSTTKTNAWVRGLPEVSQVTMAEAVVDYGKVRAEVTGYRDGLMAMSYTSYCGTAASFKKASDASLDAFRDGLAVESVY